MARIVELLAGNRSYREIGEDLGRDRQTIVNWARKHGHRSAARSGKRSALDVAHVRDLRASGLSWRVLADVFGYSPAHLHEQVRSART